jgi:quercetin dioxygenase-like cupin family protein
MRTGTPLPDFAPPALVEANDIPTRNDPMTRMLSVLAATVSVAGFGLAQHGHGDGKSKGPTVKVVSAVDVEEQVGGKKAKATTFEVTFEPGAAGTPHRHPGAIYGYVLEGEFEFAINNEKPKTLKAGDTFYEPAMALHSTSRNPSDKTKTRVLAVLVHPRDAKELVIPEPEKKEK